jgi:hypothetical protein
MTVPRPRPQRTSATRFTTLAIGAATLALLSGCAAPAHHSAAISSHPAAHPSSTATPHPAEPTAPGGATCDALAPLARVQAALASTAVAPLPYSDIEGGGPPEAYDLVVPVAGGLQCLWQDSVTAPTITLDLSVLPNATAAFAAATPTLESNDDGHSAAAVPNVPVYGDVSWTQCSNADDPWYGGCTFNIKVGNYWVEVDQQNPNFVSAYPESAADVALLQGIVSAVRGLPAAPPTWHPAAESFTLPTTCAAVLPLATLRTSVESPEIVPVSDGDPGDEVDTINGVAATASHELQCFWNAPNDDTSVAFSLVPGSGALTTTDIPAASARAGLAPVAGLGTSAYQKCENASPTFTCQALVLIGHTWIEVSVVKPLAIDPAAFDALARQIIAATGYHS